ncbi:heme utilization or adhesion protein [Actinobacillus equuli]|nr:heme utilization or adhesion protein [Actinobacillus equuli]
MAQYQALMNSGVKYAKQFNLAVGVGLTAKQMSELTTDMVWLVNKEVTLADGRKVTVLVPQVYLVARDSDITSRGAVISANQIIGSVANLQNRGVIAGRDLTRIHSNQFENRGTILGNSVDLSATQNLINLGGKIEAVKSLSLSAGKSLEIASTLSSSQSAHNAFSHTILDQTGTVKVTGKHGQLNLYSDNNLTVKAAHIESEGSVSATAKNALQITTLNISNKSIITMMRITIIA